MEPIKKVKKIWRMLNMSNPEEVNLEAGEPEIVDHQQVDTKEKEKEDYLADLREQDVDALKEKIQQHHGEIQQLQTEIRKFDDKVFLKQPFTDKQQKRFDEIKKKNKIALTKKGLVLKALKER